VIIAQQVAETFFGFGIRRVYGLPGEDHMALLDSFVASGLQYCTAFNESSAAIMAATDAHMTGLPGLVVLSLAPGVSNGVNGLLNAFLDEVPLVLISGQHPGAQLPFVVRQGFNIEQLVAPLTKWRTRITADMDVPSAIGRAVDEAMSGRPGPVYLELPDDVATAESSITAAAAARAVTRLRSRWTDGGRAYTGMTPDAATVDDLAARLSAARRPALVIGGRRRRVDRATVEAFATAYRLPVFTAPRQKGFLHSGFPYFAGTFLNGRLERRLLDQSDLVVMVDPESFDYYNRAWCFEADAIALSDAAFTEWMNPFAEQLVVDPEATLRMLTAQVPSLASQWSPADIAGYRDSLRASLLPPDRPGLSVAAAVAAALEAWPQDGYLIADAGFSKPLVAMLSDPVVPDHYLASNGLSTMGYSIPAAIGARRAGARPILAFLGDGSLLMRATELMVSASDPSPSVFVAIMDRSLTQIEVKQERRNLARVGAALPPVSCAALADAFGIDGLDVDNADDLRAAVSKGLRGDRPALIGAHVDPAPSRQLFDLLRG
jgi:acetolactate synthase I/II/III large subunit